jgi:hypothetical protein
MSCFIGTPSGVGLGQWLTRDDTRLRCNTFNDDVFVHVRKTEPFHHEGFMSPWWPGNVGFDASGNDWLRAVWQEQPEKYSGAVSKMAFVGVTRDAYGTALGDCTVKLYKTADGAYPGTKDRLLYEAVSDASGNFAVYTPYYPDTHYMVSYKAGSPDVEGTTVNTLIGA